MPRPRKFAFNKTVLLITTSIEEGILMPANPLVKLIILSCLARAQELHPVRICHFVVTATHAHLLVIVDNPNDVDGFMCRFKTESAHAINHLLGRAKRTVWCEGYDSPVVGTPSKCVSDIVYILTNPAKDNLVSSIEHFPGLSSHQMIKSGKLSRKCPWIRRPAIPELPEGFDDFEGLAVELARGATQAHTFQIHPDAWMEAFKIPEGERASYNKQIEDGVRALEAELQRAREAKGRRVFGAEYLASEAMRLDYRPKRIGRRMWCRCDDKEVRKVIIGKLKAALAEGREVYEMWKRGDYSKPYPLGLYPPARPRTANLMRFV